MMAAVEQTAEGDYRVSFASPTVQAVRADLVVAADGADGTIRDDSVHGGKAASPPLRAMAGRLVQGISSGPMWEEQRADELLELVGSGQRVGAVRLLDGTAYWYATVGDAYTAMASSPLSLASALSSLPAWVSSLVAATPTASYVVGPLRHHSPPATLHRHGVVLVGSSSVVLPPDLQQQAASSLESALTLALCLRSSTGMAGGLQRYSALRAPRLASLHTAAVAEWQRAHPRSRVVAALRRMANSLLLPSQARLAAHETGLGYDVLRPFPECRPLFGPRARLFGQAGQNFADRIESDLKGLEERETEEWSSSKEL